MIYFCVLYETLDDIHCHTLIFWRPPPLCVLLGSCWCVQGSPIQVGLIIHYFLPTESKANGLSKLVDVQIQRIQVFKSSWTLD